jgi:hypothetical protein
VNKRFLLLIGCLVGAGLAALLLTKWFINKEENRRAPTEKELHRQWLAAGGKQAATVAPVSIRVDPKHAVRLAIGSLGLPDGEQNGRASDLLLTDLAGAPGIEMVERQALERILKELNLSLSGLVRAGDAVRVGKLARADWFLLGTPLAINGGHFIVVRIVDAKTGIFRDTTIASAQGGPVKLALDLAAFVRKCRAKASTDKSPVYLALGAFEDLSLNNRLADFPTQLRSYLTAAYGGVDVTLLERDHVETLLRELQLDLAGLTEDSGPGRVAAMRSAVWLVEGDYQQYDAPEMEVELALKVSRMFGRQTNVVMRGVAGPELFQKVKGTIDQIIIERQEYLRPSRRTELAVQMKRGQDLMGFQTRISYNAGGDLTEQEARLHRRNTEEAIRAFKTVLLLEPTNRQARVCLGICYCKPEMGRFDEGREMFREVIEERVKDAWTKEAGDNLLGTFMWADPQETFTWFANAEAQSLNTNAAAFFHTHAEWGRGYVKLRQGAGAQPEILAENNLRDGIRSAQSVFEGKGGLVRADFGMDEYVYFFRPDKVKGGRKLADLLPRLIAEFPSMAPHLTAAALSYQRETNNPVVEEFKRQMTLCLAHPDKVFAASQFWSKARYGAYSWCMEHGQPALAADIMRGVKQAALTTKFLTYDDQDQMALAYALKWAAEWKEALDVFETFSNMPVVMTRGNGPWGRAFSPVLTAEEAATCKRQLGIQVGADPREFQIETNCLFLKDSAFAVEPHGIWVATVDQLLNLDFGLQTNKAVPLPKESFAAINCVLAGPDTVWIGTDGNGLLRFDKNTGQMVHFTEKDGLASDIVCTLCLEGQTLWIGYGAKAIAGHYNARLATGALGLLDIPRTQFRVFTPSLAAGTDVLKNPAAGERADQPTHKTVRAIAAGPDGDIWFLAADAPLRRYRPGDDTWASISNVKTCSTLTADSQRLFVARFGGEFQRQEPGPAGVSILNFADNTWTELGDLGVLPTAMVSALALDGDDLWVGCNGYIAGINLRKNELTNYAPIHSATVENLQIGGGYIWAQFDRHLHRARLP